METAAQMLLKPVLNVDQIALGAAAEILALEPSTFKAGAGQLTARIQGIIREAIANTTSTDLALYWHRRANENQIQAKRTQDELLRAMRALQKAGYRDTMYGWEPDKSRTAESASTPYHHLREKE